MSEELKQENGKQAKHGFEVRLRCSGDLRLAGGDVTEPLVKGRSEQTVESDGRVYVIHIQGDASVVVPDGWAVVVERVNGDTRTAALTGGLRFVEAYGDMRLVDSADITIESAGGDVAVRNAQGVTMSSIGGDVSIRHAGAATVTKVSGDLSAHSLGGSLAVHGLGGDISVRAVAGDVTLSGIAGDGSLRGLEGATNDIQVAGDLRLVGPFVAGTHTFSSGDDIVLRWPEGADLNLTAKGKRITNRLPFDEVEDAESALSGRIGTADVDVTLNAGGRVVLKIDKRDGEWSDDVNIDLDFEALGERISTEIGGKMAEFAERMAEFSTMFDANSMSRFETRAEKAARKAEKAIERVMSRMEQRLSAADRKRRPAPPPPPPAPQKDRSAEQAKILEMLQEGKLTVEQANQLLEALD